jgi:hypothetical protein
MDLDFNCTHFDLVHHQHFGHIDWFDLHQCYHRHHRNFNPMVHLPMDKDLLQHAEYKDLH